MSELSLATFLAGAAVGLAVAMPIGPMGVLCVQRTLTFGCAAGLAIGLAAATVQATYGLIATLGFGPTGLGLAGAARDGLAALSAAALFWFAFRILRRDVTMPQEARFTTGDLGRFYRDGLAFGFANPLTVVLFFSAFPALASAEDMLHAPALVTGVFAEVVGWYGVLSAVAWSLRGRLSANALRLANRAAALILASLGLSMLAGALGLR